MTATSLSHSRPMAFPLFRRDGSGGSGDRVGPEERLDRLGDQHAAVLLLKVLEDGGKEAAHSDAAAVERVHELGRALGVAPQPRAHAPRLVVAAIGARGDLAILALEWHPDLQVVG